MNKYRFFFHYNKPKKAMTVHFRGTCYIAKDVKCFVPCNSKWRKSQPRLVMQGWANTVQVRNDIAVIV